MASFKTQVYRMYENCGDVVKGIASADFTGHNFIGKLDDPRNTRQIEDFHRTIPQFEIDPCPPGLQVMTLQDARIVNAFFSKVAEQEPDAFAHIASALGLEGEGPVAVRVGIWDE